jgi:hypothetical protein
MKDKDKKLSTLQKSVNRLETKLNKLDDFNEYKRLKSVMSKIKSPSAETAKRRFDVSGNVSGTITINGERCGYKISQVPAHLKAIISPPK